MSKPILFLDMDGVLADFAGHLATSLNININDINRSYNLTEAFGLPFLDIDQIVRRHNFWIHIPALPWAKKLVDILKRDFDVVILSAPWDNHPQCLADKIHWCRFHLGISQSHVILTKHKHLLSRPGLILIDDYNKNCFAWSRMGGIAIEFPARHNDWHGMKINTDLIITWVQNHIEKCKEIVAESHESAYNVLCKGIN